MAPATPERLVNFCHLIATTDCAELLKRPDVVDPRNLKAEKEPQERKSESLLLSSFSATRELRSKSGEFQLALFDFRGGYCDMCRVPPELRGLSSRHMHGRQGSGVLETTEIPGLLIYPGLLHETVVQKRLTDDLLYSARSTSPETQQSREERKQDVSVPLPEHVSSLLESVFSMRCKTAAMQHFSNETIPSPQIGSDESGQALHVPLGCDSVLVFCLRDDDLALLPEQARTPPVEAESTPPLAEFGWDDLLASSDEEEHNQSIPKRRKLDSSSDASAVNNQYAHRPKIKLQGASGSSDGGDVAKVSSETLQQIHTKRERGQLGIVLRPGDVVSMTGPALRAWRCAAKVMPETSPASAPAWPDSDVKVRIPALQVYRGSMKDSSASITIS